MRTDDECDLVMDGGVTSAVLYAGLVSALGRRFRLRQVGGTSAGALVAAGGAIAEAQGLRPEHGAPERRRLAFERIGAVVDDMKVLGARQRTGLLNLFKPEPDVAAAFEVFLVALRLGQPSVGGAGALVLALYRHFPLWALGGAVVAALPNLLSSRHDWDAIVATAALALGLSFAGAVVGLLVMLVRRLPAHHFGLCTGGGERTEKTLTNAFHVVYNELAGLQAADDPVCFRHLWYASTGGRAVRPDQGRDVDLQMIVTALQIRRPIRVPNDAGVEPLRGFYYDPAEWKRLFPGPVMRYLVSPSNWPPGLGPEVGPEGQRLLPMPRMQDLPIVVAVRMSMAMPLLMSMVPVFFYWRGSDEPEASTVSAPVPRRVYLCDGGITSNSPVDMFDMPLPSRPTFTVSLYTTADVGRPPHFAGDVQGPEQKPTEAVTRGIGALPSLVSEVFSTAMYWRDTLQRNLPGYRERVLHVPLGESYGGMNLLMKPEQLDELRRLGEVGAERLASYKTARRIGHFSRWEHHRWLRVRTSLAAFQQYVRRLGRSSTKGTPDYGRLLDAVVTPEPGLVDDRAAEQGLQLLQAAQQLGQVDEVTPIEQKPPRARADLGLRPPY